MTEYEQNIRLLAEKHMTSLWSGGSSWEWHCSCGAGTRSSSAARTVTHDMSVSYRDRHLQSELRKMKGFR